MRTKVNNNTTNIDESTFMECGDCRYFSFFDYCDSKETRGKCNRDSLYEYKPVRSTDHRCRSCKSCKHPVL